ncbi:MAG TPA: hypothetical protein VGQ30_07995, partial [Gemmatimonadaceae bacterium]|nr:hypothetical protein [Gemmatimonadaceae bacterium]
MTAPGGLHSLAASSRPRIRFSPERRLAICVAAASGLWLMPGRAGGIAGSAGLAVIALLAAADFALLPARRALTLVRELPDSVGIGDSVEGKYVLTSHWLRPVIVEIEDHPSPLVSGGAGLTRVMIAPNASLELAFQVTGETRGRAELGDVGARMRTPIGLMSARVLFSAHDSIMVVPSLSGVRRFRLLAMQHRLET